MAEFTGLNINHGLSTELFSNGKLNSQILVEEGCWYLCTDTAELFLGLENGELKRINEVTDLGTGTVDLEVLTALRAEVDAVKTSLADYAKAADVTTEINAAIAGVKIPEVPTKTSQLTNDSGFLTTHQDISGKADKAVTLAGYGITDAYTRTEIDAKLLEIEAGADFDPSTLAGFVSEDEWNERIADYAKTSDIPTDYLKAIPDEYITESELDTELNNYATKQIVTDAINEIKIPDVSEFIKKSDLSDYALKSELPDITGKADTKHTHEEYADKVHTHTEYAIAEHTHDEYLTEHQSLADYAKKTDIPSLNGYAKTSDLFSGSYNDLTDKPEIPSLEGYATEQFVTDAIADYEAEHEAVKTVQTTLQNKVIPVVEKVETEIVPIVPIVEGLVVAKANDVPFTESKIVVNSIGGFVAGEDIKNLTVAQLFAKLLGFSIDSGETPDEPTTIPDKIIANNSAMYQINELGEIVEISYNYKEFTDAEYAAAPTQDYFYQLKDAEGAVIESGYQHVSEENDSMYYLVLLPKELDFNTNVTIQYWDNGNKVWSPAIVTMSNDLTMIEEALAEAEIELPAYDSDKYTLWIDASLDTCAGTDYRFIIHE